MNKQNNQKYEGGPIPLDESWWAAVLAEEEQRGHPAPKQPGGSGSHEGKPASKATPVDWLKAQRIYDQDEAVYLEVVGNNRGGLLVEGDSLQGFVPLSHLVDLSIDKAEFDHDEEEIDLELSAYLGRELLLKVIECDADRGRVVFSERAALAEPGRRNQLLDELKPGQKVRGEVTNVTDFGVFVDLGGVEGLIHVSELSWGRVRHPSDVVCVGQSVSAHVIHIDKDRTRVALSLKRLIPNPWDTAEDRYCPGMVLDAVITSVVNFGAFARLEEGLDGLIHISEMCPPGERINPEDLVTEGQHVRVRVLQVDAARQRLGLSLSPESELYPSLNRPI